MSEKDNDQPELLEKLFSTPVILTASLILGISGRLSVIYIIDEKKSLCFSFLLNFFKEGRASIPLTPTRLRRGGVSVYTYRKCVFARMDFAS